MTTELEATAATTARAISSNCICTSSSSSSSPSPSLLPSRTLMSPSSIARRIRGYLISTLLLIASTLGIKHDYSHSHSSSDSAPSASSSLLLFSHAASQFPGLPTPIESAHLCCQWHTLLPRDKWIFTVGNRVWEYDSVHQKAFTLYNTLEFMSPPYSPGVNIGSFPNHTISTFNTVMKWWNEKAYWFAKDIYWRYKDNSYTSQSGPSYTANGWMPGINTQEGMFIASNQWSWSFVGKNVQRYDNFNDRIDPDYFNSATGQSIPRPAKDVFGASLPVPLQDIDIHPEREEWMIFHDDNITLWSPVTSSVLPSYPRAMHNDAVDGGTFGMNRTRCSGVMDLSTMIGFVEDKSPEDFLRLMPYADNLTCDWMIMLPSRMLRTPTAGYQGISIYFTRFDLGSGASVEITEMNDLPENIPEIGWEYFTPDEADSGQWSREWYDAGSHDAIQPKKNAVPSVLGKFTQVNQPNVSQSPSIIRSSGQSMAVRVRFTTTSDSAAHQGTGFALRFAATSPTRKTYVELDGLIWLSSLGLIQQNQSIIVAPATQTYGPVSFAFRFHIYPLSPQAANQVYMLVESTLTGEVVKNCTGSQLYAYGYAGPRCSFTTTPAQGPVKLTYVTGVGFSASVMGEYHALTICNNSPATPQKKTAINGSISDGSGIHYRYRENSDCSWLIGETPVFKQISINETVNGTTSLVPYNKTVSSEALFVKLTFTRIELSTQMADKVLIYDGDSPSAPLLATVQRRQTDADPYPSVHTTQESMFVRFVSSLGYTDQGWDANWRISYAPIPSTITLDGFDRVVGEKVLAQLALLNSTAAAVTYQGRPALDVPLRGLDHLGLSCDFGYENWYKFFFRWFPLSVRKNDPQTYELLTLYPYSLSQTNSSYWLAMYGKMVSDDVLASVYEYESTSGSFLQYVSPLLGDYDTRLLALIYSHGHDLISGWNVSDYDNTTYYAIARDEILHVAPYIAKAGKSTVVRLPAVLPSNETLSALLRNQSAPEALAFFGNLTMQSPHIVGTPFNLVVTTRDEYGQVMEGFRGDDLRPFLSSDSTQSSPTIRVTKILPGSYLLSVTPIVTSSDYFLTILVTGHDVVDGPFRPYVIASDTSASRSTIKLAATGASLLSSPNIPQGDNIEIIVTVRDRYGNPRGALAVSDKVELSWPDHNVREKDRGVNDSRSDFHFLVDAGDTYMSSILEVRVNGALLGYDSSRGSLSNFAAGINVVIGSPEYINYRTPMRVQTTLVFFTCICILGTLGLMYYIYSHRAFGMIRASSPNFLLLMLVGALLEYSTVIPMTLPEVSDISCAIEPALGHLGFFAIFGALFVKTGRVKAIFTDKRLMVKTLTDGSLLIRLGAMTAVYVAYYIVWMIHSRPRPTLITKDYTTYRICSSPEYLWPTLILVVEGIVVAYAAYLSTTIWTLPHLFNESKFLLVATYNVAVIGGLFTLLVKVELMPPNTQLIFACVGVLFVTTTVLVAIFAPKIYAVLYDQPVKKKSMLQPTQSAHQSVPANPRTQSLQRSVHDRPMNPLEVERQAERELLAAGARVTSHPGSLPAFDHAAFLLATDQEKNVLNDDGNNSMAPMKLPHTHVSILDSPQPPQTLTVDDSPQGERLIRGVSTSAAGAGTTVRRDDDCSVTSTPLQRAQAQPTQPVVGVPLIIPDRNGITPPSTESQQQELMQPDYNRVRSSSGMQPMDLNNSSDGSAQNQQTSLPDMQAQRSTSVGSSDPSVHASAINLNAFSNPSSSIPINVAIDRAAAAAIAAGPSSGPSSTRIQHPTTRLSLTAVLPGIPISLPRTPTFTGPTEASSRNSLTRPASMTLQQPQQSQDNSILPGQVLAPSTPTTIGDQLPPASPSVN